MWLVTKRCGKNFLLGDLVTTTIINSNLRVPGLLLFSKIYRFQTRFEFLGPVCRARRADHFSVEILRDIYFRSHRLPLLQNFIGGDRDQNLIIFHLSFFDIFQRRASHSCRGIQGGHFCVQIARNIYRIIKLDNWSRRMLDNRI